MACFLVPAAEAVAVTAAVKMSKSKSGEAEAASVKPLIKKQLKWLNGMLWGGALLLCFEHIWHGEVVPWFPFLTAAEDPKDMTAMLHEMSTVGVVMAVLVTAAWIGMVVVTNIIAKREITEAVEQS